MLCTFAGAYTLLRGRAYNAQVAYLPSSAGAPQEGTLPSRECRAECRVCRNPPASPEKAVGKEAPFMSSSRRALDQGGWVHAQVGVCLAAWIQLALTWMP